MHIYAPVEKKVFKISVNEDWKSTEFAPEQNFDWANLSGSFAQVFTCSDHIS